MSNVARQPLLRSLVRRTRRARVVDAGLPLGPLALLAACGGSGGGGGGGGPATGTPPPPAVAGTSDAAVVVAGSSSATGNLLANDTATGGTATVTAVSVQGGITGTVGAALQGALGRLTVQADGSYSYAVGAGTGAYDALAAGQTAVETFLYTPSVNGSAGAQQTLTITLTGVNDAPVLVNDSGGAVAPGASTTGNVLANDSDVDRGTTLIVTAVRAGTAAASAEGQGASAALPAVTGIYGTLTMNDDGSYRYTVNAADPDTRAIALGQNATETFTYTVSDGTATRTATLAFTVPGLGSAPTVVSDSRSAFPGETIAGNLFANDSDADGQALGLASITRADGASVVIGQAYRTSYGTLTVQADGSFTYVIDGATQNVLALRSGQNVVDGFIYTATDGSLSGSSTLSLIVNGRNDPPLAVFDNAITPGGVLFMDAGQVAAGNLLSNDADPDGIDTVRVISVRYRGVEIPIGVQTELTYYKATFNADGSYILDSNTPASRALNPGGVARDLPTDDNFTYTISDGLDVASATLRSRVRPVTDPPVLTPDTAAVTSGQTATGNVRANDFVIDNNTSLPLIGTLAGPAGSTVTPAGTSGSGAPVPPFTATTTYGVLSLAADGSFSYVANQAATQALNAGQTVSDVFTYNGTGTLTVTVTGINDATGGIRGLTLGLAGEGGPPGVARQLFNNNANRSNNDAVFDPDDSLRLLQINGLAADPSFATAAFRGNYGTLTVETGTSGSVRYTVDNTANDVIALAPGQIATEYFSFRVGLVPGTGGGGPDVTGVITQQIQGNIGAADPTAPSIFVATVGSTIPVINGTGGSDLLVVRGMLSNSTLSAGNDTAALHLDTGGLAGVVDGGDGTDTLRIVDNVGATLTPTQLDLAARLDNFEKIDLTGTGNTTLGIRVQDVIDATGAPDQLFVTGTAGDRIDIDIPAWTMGADQTVDGQLYRTYTSGAATLFVDPDILVI